MNTEKLKTDSEQVAKLVMAAGRTSGTANTPESHKALRAIKKLVVTYFPTDIVTFNAGHFYCSGFVRRGNRVAYFMYSDFRYFTNNVTVRTAKDERDYTGGINHNRNTTTFINTLDLLLRN